VKTVDLYTNGVFWTCSKCGEQQTALLRRVEVDLDDPAFAEVRDMLVDAGELDEDDYDIDDDFGVEDEAVWTLFREPKTVQCGGCGTVFATRVLSMDESDKARIWRDAEDAADELLGGPAD
jgi:transcription elongation factor Elf1